MIQFLLAAPNSGSGKTTRLRPAGSFEKNRGYAPCAFKSGPDYIDPMFHRAVLGWRATIWIYSFPPRRRRAASTPAARRATVPPSVRGHGLYDGLSGTSTTASAWQVADTLNLPVLLVVRPKGPA